MRSFRARRIRHSLLALAVLTVFFAIRWQYAGPLGDLRRFDGWVLMLAIALPMLFALRRKLSTVPLWDASAWMQLHAYAGIVSALIFLVHTQGRWPSTGINALLACLFVAVFVSGVVGMALNRLVPPRLISQGPRQIYEKIAAQRRDIVDRIEALAIESVSVTGTDVIADFYAKTLGPQLLKQARWPILFGQGDQRVRKTLSDFGQIRKYLNADGLRLLKEIETLTVRKMELDTQEALQFILKVWPLVHAPLSYSLMFVVVFHIFIEYSYATGRP